MSRAITGIGSLAQTALDPPNGSLGKRAKKRYASQRMQPGPSDLPSRDPFAAFASRDYRVYAAARLFNTVAVQMQSVAVGYHVYSITHRPIHLGYVGLAQFLPVVSLSLVAGHAADRFDRRAVALLCILLNAACAVLLLLCSLSPAPSLPAIYATLFVFGVSRTFNAPALTALLPSLVPKADFPNAATWQSTFWEIAAIGGPSLGGAIYAIRDAPGPVYIASAFTFGVAGLLLLAVRTRTGRLEQRPPSLSTALAGLRYVWAKKILLGSISLDFFAVFLGGAVALLPVYATDVLHVGPTGFGVLRSAPAVGAGLMALTLAFRPLTQRAGAKMLAGVGIFGAATIVFGLSKSFPLSLLALAVLGAADMVSVVVRMTLEQLATPPEMRGRVSAVNMVFVGASNELGELESGVAASLLGPVPAVVLGGVGTMVVVGLWTLLFPDLRRVDRLDEGLAEPHEA
jgi:MFS family permease